MFIVFPDSREELCIRSATCWILYAINSDSEENLGHCAAQVHSRFSVLPDLLTYEHIERTASSSEASGLHS